MSRQIHTLQKLVEDRLAEERTARADVLDEVGHPYHEAVWMLELMIEQSEVELRWIRRILKDIDKRAPARNPAKTD